MLMGLTLGVMNGFKNEIAVMGTQRETYKYVDYILWFNEVYGLLIISQ